MQIHSKKKRNKLEHKRLHDLVYIKYNQQLAQRYNIRNEIYLIALNNIDEWLEGQVDDNNNEDGEMRCCWVLSRGGTPG